MKIPPSFTKTEEMLSLIAQIEALRLFFSKIKIPHETKNKIERLSLLKSSLYSARIEGNPLSLSDFQNSGQSGIKKREVFNIIDAAHLIDAKIKKGRLSKSIISKLHAAVLKGTSPDAGRVRCEPSAIFNEAHIAVYLAPPHRQINRLLDQLFKYINSPKKKFPLICAFVSHLIFEKIHPFLDGNGRVGRLLISAVLKAKGWEFIFTIPFEEYLDSHRSEYYFHLDKGMQDTDEYLLFMLNAFLQELEILEGQIENQPLNEEKFLSPRQEEILNVIRDHVVVSFDVIRRRFLKVPERTLRYDLKKMVDRELVEKTGETRGRYYRVSASYRKR